MIVGLRAALTTITCGERLPIGSARAALRQVEALRGCTTQEGVIVAPASVLRRALVHAVCLANIPGDRACAVHPTQRPGAPYNPQ